MQFKTFIVPASGNTQSENDLNNFLKTHKIVTVRTEFICKETPMWCFLVEYIPTVDQSEISAKASGKKIDYMKVLSQEDFAIFSKLREKRKIISEEEKIPPYVIFTDEQIAEIAKIKPKSLNELSSIAGIGEQKISKYGKIVLDIISLNETSR